MALIFLLTIPLLFSVPVSLATAEMATAMPVEGGFYRWTRAAFGDFWVFAARTADASVELQTNEPPRGIAISPKR